MTTPTKGMKAIGKKGSRRVRGRRQELVEHLSPEAQGYLEEGLAPPPTHSDVKPRRVIKRKPGTVSVNYFTMDTQAAIVEFQKEPLLEVRNKVFHDRIYPAFASLVENLINVYGYHVSFESKDDLRNECIEFLFTTVGKFNVERGSKAFSYFNVVAKNWLTIRSKTNSKRQSTHVSIDWSSAGLRNDRAVNLSQSQRALGFHDLDQIERQNPVVSPEDAMIAKESETKLPNLVRSLTDLARNEVEVEVMRAIGILTSNLDDLDLLNKRAVLLYLRELTGLNSKQVSGALASLKKHYKTLRDADLNDLT